LTLVADGVANIGERRQHTIEQSVLGTLGGLGRGLLRREHVIIAPDVEQVGGRSSRIGELAEAGSPPNNKTKRVNNCIFKIQQNWTQNRKDDSHTQVCAERTDGVLVASGIGAKAAAEAREATITVGRSIFRRVSGKIITSFRWSIV